MMCNDCFVKSVNNPHLDIEMLPCIKEALERQKKKKLHKERSEARKKMTASQMREAGYFGNGFLSWLVMAYWVYLK